MVKASFAIYKHIPHRKLQLYKWFSHEKCYPRWGYLTYWGRVKHICVGNLSVIGSDNGVSPGWRQAINWTNAGILLIGPLETNFSEILIQLVAFSFNKMRLKVSIAKWRLYCLGINVLKGRDYHLSFLHCQGSYKGLLLWSETDTGDDLLLNLCQVISRTSADLLFIWSFCTNSMILSTCNEPFITWVWHCQSFS